MAGTFTVHADWNDDGDFTDPREDITAQVLDARAPVTASYGRDQARALSPVKAGEGRLVLDNDSRDYSPENASSPLAGNVIPGRSMQITGTYGALTTTILSARIDDLKLHVGHDEHHVDVDLVDALGQLRGIKVSTGLYQGLRPGEAIGLVLDAAGWPASLRVLDTGATVMPYWWVDGDDAFDAVLELVDSEGPPALITVDTAGRIVFRDRHHRLQSTASTTVQATWRSSGAEPLIGAPASYNDGRKEIINSVSYELPQRRVAGVLSQVWSSQGQVSIAAGQTVTVVAQASNPFLGAIVPVAGTDYSVTGTVTVSLSRTSGLSTTINLTASTGGAAVVTDLSLRAMSVEPAATLQIQAEDASSVAEYGRRSLPDGRAPRWASIGDASAIANIILTQRAQRLPTITVSMVSANAARITQQFTRDLSDLVHVVEEHSGLDAPCFIEQISHLITQGGLEHRTTWGLEKAPEQITGVFILGSATSGVLGTNKLGRRAGADPTTMFVLGSPTNGVLGTNILVP